MRYRCEWICNGGGQYGREWQQDICENGEMEVERQWH